jgi:hypothetical protein
MKLIQTYFLGFSSAILLCVILAYILESKRPVVSGLSIKCEYYLEVSEDSIWIESQAGKVYTGKYTDLDSLISVDNK